MALGVWFAATSGSSREGNWGEPSFLYAWRTSSMSQDHAGTVGFVEER